jgi:hypothetical protein
LRGLGARRWRRTKKTPPSKQTQLGATSRYSPCRLEPTQRHTARGRCRREVARRSGAGRGAPTPKGESGHRLSKQVPQRPPAGYGEEAASQAWRLEAQMTRLGDSFQARNFAMSEDGIGGNPRAKHPRRSKAPGPVTRGTGPGCGFQTRLRERYGAGHAQPQHQSRRASRAGARRRSGSIARVTPERID